MEQTKKIMTEEAALVRLSGLCCRAEYCLMDMRHKMMRWQLPDGAEARILKRLTADKYIDENRYAHAFVRSKFRFNRWGKDKIVRALKMKGISDEDISDAIVEIDEQESLDTLKELLTTKMRTVKYNTDYELYMKLLRFAVSRGFSLDSARICLEGLVDS